MVVVQDDTFWKRPNTSHRKKENFYNDTGAWGGWDGGGQEEREGEQVCNQGAQRVV